ncbi:MAG: DUF4292 domain-containing protein [Deltaproteobacteria bacterium]|nr:DUF4292 domain-containing protein [Deltaproteobacteria bacterium]
MRLEKEGARRRQLNGLIQAKMGGIKGLLAKADVDVIIERPARMLVSVRSFFEQPLYVFATDGVTASVFDGSQDSGALFFRGPVNGKVLKGLLQMALWPQEAVGLFLGSAAVEGTQAVQLDVDENRGIYSIGLRSHHGPVQIVTARLQDDALIQVQIYERSGSLRYEVAYDDIRDVDGIPLAHHLTFGVPQEDGSQSKIHFHLKDVKLNDTPFDDAAFEVSLPAGATFRPLSLLESKTPAPPKILDVAEKADDMPSENGSE